MRRTIEADLLEWKTQPKRKPLLIRGARQVGKSYVIEKFGRNHFKHMVVINFELDKMFIHSFDVLDPAKIIRSIELLVGQSVQVGSTLLFLDEIQQCPNAILALRYFKEKMPDLHIIGAGSFLEFVINDERYQQPVGRVQSLYLKPLSFNEYLLASGERRLADYLSSVNIDSGVETAIHNHLLAKCREYFILGGMPEVVDNYISTKKYIGCDKAQATILEYYQRDLAKYQKRISSRSLEKIFIKAPGLVAKHFKYVDIDPEIQARDQKPALEALIKAGILYPVYHSSANGLPFQVGVNEKKLKLLFLDVGLVKHAMRLDVDTMLCEDLTLLNAGALAEQFVGQEILAYTKNYEEAKLFYWKREKRGAQAEVDYVVNIGPKIFPIEVKSGKTGRLRSLQIFLDEKKSPLGIRVSQHPLSLDGRILSVPFYMINELPRLIDLVG